MATVANNPSDDSPSIWLIFANLVLNLVSESRRTWFCTSWVPFIRYIVTVVIVVNVVCVSGYLFLHFLLR